MPEEKSDDLLHVCSGPFAPTAVRRDAGGKVVALVRFEGGEFRMQRLAN